VADLDALLNSLPTPLAATVLQRGPGNAIVTVTADSRKVRAGSLFVALKGALVDGHRYVSQAVKHGACCVVVEEDPGPVAGITVIQVNDSHAALGLLAAALEQFPSRQMTMIGLTGTNGKTTVSWMIEKMLQENGCRVGVIGTVNYRYSSRNGEQVVVKASLTTPDSVFLQQLLHKMADEGVTHVVMETSSHALLLKRLEGIMFDVAVFTNLSRDHLDFHGDMDRYYEAKRLLFSHYLKQDGQAVVVTEGGDKQGWWAGRLCAEMEQDGREDMLLRCGLDKSNTLHADNLEMDINGFSATLDIQGKQLPFHCGLTGSYNVLNVLAAAGVGAALGLQAEQSVAGLTLLSRVPGRLERVQLSGAAVSDQPAVFVDYAHTPDALRNVLQTLQGIGNGRLICVFGCGGDRDQGKRPQMGQVAGEYADIMVITSDNPRSEDPAGIIEQVAAGCAAAGCRQVTVSELFAVENERLFTCITDRKNGVYTGCALAGPEDIVLIAGKGHENYQLLGDTRIFFDDRLCSLDGLLAWSLRHLLRATAGKWISGRQQHLLAEVSTDTRKLEQGDIFVALAGENFDGHDYVETAVQAGAGAVIVEHEVAEIPDHVLLIQVDDSLQALGDMAAYRRKLLGGNIQVAAVTGSSGKTTVKEMTAAIFSRHLSAVQTGIDPLLKTAGNFNNLIGLPLSLLPIGAGHAMAILEMGMNHLGEIKRLTQVADPDIACITNIQAAHLEGLGSIEGVARAKGELFAGLRTDAVAVVNYDNPYVRKLATSAERRLGFAVTPAGRRYKPAVRVTRIINLGEEGMRFTLHVDKWSQRISVPAPGVHNVSNCAAAAAIAFAAGIAPETIAAGLVAFRNVDKRMQSMTLPGGIHVLNDCYNANPSSMAAALKTVQEFGTDCRRIALLADMLELGADTNRAHKEMGRLAAELGYDQLLVTGSFADHVVQGAVEGGMKADRVSRFADNSAVADWLYHEIMNKKINRGDWLLVKGSRGMHLEEVLQELEHRCATGIEEN
jgi:murE/murF fusion protein